MALPHQAAQACLGDAWQGGMDEQTHCSMAGVNTSLSHTHPEGWRWRWPRVQSGCWGPKPATAASLPSLLAKADLSSPDRTGKFSMATYVLKQPLLFSLFPQEQSWVSIPDSVPS